MILFRYFISVMKMEDESPICAEMKPVLTRNTASVIGTTMSTARHLLIGENLKTFISLKNNIPKDASTLKMMKRVPLSGNPKIVARLNQIKLSTKLSVHSAVMCSTLTEDIESFSGQ